MTTHGRGAGASIERDLAGVVGNLAALRPQAGAGVAAQAAPGDAGDTGNQRLPVGVETTGHGEDLDPAVFLTAMSMAIDRLEAIDRGLCPA